MTRTIVNCSLLLFSSIKFLLGVAEGFLLISFELFVLAPRPAPSQRKDYNRVLQKAQLTSLILQYKIPCRNYRLYSFYLRRAVAPISQSQSPGSVLDGRGDRDGMFTSLLDFIQIKPLSSASIYAKTFTKSVERKSLC